MSNNQAVLSRVEVKAPARDLDLGINAINSAVVRMPYQAGAMNAAVVRMPYQAGAIDLRATRTILTVG